MRANLLTALMVLSGACYYSDPQVAVGYSAGYSVGYAAPAMTYISPGVQVVMDYDYPVFYSDGYYWRYDGGLWYRSGYYNRGWNVWYDVPHSVRGISRPEGYVRYRGNGYRPNQNWGRRNAAPAPNVRTAPDSGYRSNQNWGRRNAAPAPSSPASRSAPAVRAPVVRGNNGHTHRQGPSRPIVRDHR